MSFLYYWEYFYENRNNTHERDFQRKIINTRIEEVIDEMEEEAEEVQKTTPF